MTDEQARCRKAPAGWTCTREAGHDGPCAAKQLPATASRTAAIDEAADEYAEAEQEECYAQGVFHAEQVVDVFVERHKGNVRALLLEGEHDEACAKLARLRSAFWRFATQVES